MCLEAVCPPFQPGPLLPRHLQCPGRGRALLRGTLLTGRGVTQPPGPPTRPHQEHPAASSALPSTPDSTGPARPPEPVPGCPSVRPSRSMEVRAPAATRALQQIDTPHPCCPPVSGAQNIRASAGKGAGPPGASTGPRGLQKRQIKTCACWTPPTSRSCWALGMQDYPSWLGEPQIGTVRLQRLPTSAGAACGRAGGLGGRFKGRKHRDGADER